MIWYDMILVYKNWWIFPHDLLTGGASGCDLQSPLVSSRGTLPASIFPRWNMRIWWGSQQMTSTDPLPSGELTVCHGKIHYAIHGKIHYFDWAIFHCKLWMFTRRGTLWSFSGFGEKNIWGDQGMDAGQRPSDASSCATLMAAEHLGWG